MQVEKLMTETALEARLAIVEAQFEIRNLVSRYSIAVDTRDMALLASLYLPDFAATQEWGDGGAGEVRRISQALGKFYRSFHQVSSHAITIRSATHAIGTVYAKAEHEIGHNWIASALIYSDQYESRDGHWYFSARRQIQKIYNADMAAGPVAPFDAWPLSAGPDPRVNWPLEEPSWRVFWSGQPDGQPEKLSRRP